MSDDKITQAELRDLFGDEMSWEVYDLLFVQAPDSMTVAEVREKLKGMAVLQKANRASLDHFVNDKWAEYKEGTTLFAGHSHEKAYRLGVGSILSYFEDFVVSAKSLVTAHCGDQRVTNPDHGDRIAMAFLDQADEILAALK